MAEEPLRIVQHTAQALGLPLLSLEIELGPSQVEAVFDATDALTAADNMVLFRNAVARRCAARATTPPSCAARRFPTSCPAAGTCTSRWWMHRPAPTVFMRTRPHPAARRPMRSTRCRTWASITWRAAGPRARHGRVLHAHGQRLRALPPQCAGAAIGAVGARQPGRHAARGGRSGRRRHAHRKPHWRACRQPVPVPGRADPRRAGRHGAPACGAASHRCALCTWPRACPPTWTTRSWRCRPMRCWSRPSGRHFMDYSGATQAVRVHTP
jgi:hypothetical protein